MIGAITTNLGSFARFSGVLDQSEGKKMAYCKIQI